MTLRFAQSVRLEPQLRELEVPRLIVPRHLAAPRRGREKDRLIFGEGSSSGGAFVVGRRPSEPDVIPEVVEVEVAIRSGRAPRWLEGRFRPRNLSLEGQRLLERLDPAVVRHEGPIVLLDEVEIWDSLDERMHYLEQKYLLLDMIRRGYGVEADGRFWPVKMAREAERHEMLAARRRREISAPRPPMDERDAIGWLGAYRRASWDQVRALHPAHKDGVDRLLQHLLDSKLVQEERVRLGEGSLTTLGLTPSGVKELRSMPEGPDLIARGFGARGSGPGIGEYHEQAVGDAIGYCTHEVLLNNGEVTGITLERGLRREYLGAERIPDLRIEFSTDVGYYHWDIEILGIGMSEYRRGPAAEKMGSSASVRGFDPLGRTLTNRASDVRVKR